MSRDRPQRWFRDYRARYYDPQTGRFLSEDPIGFAGGANFYSYALNGPTNFIDFTGQDATIAQNGNDVTVTATILLHGNRSDSTHTSWYAYYWQWIINSWWSNLHYGKCNIKADVTVIPDWDKATARRGPINRVDIVASTIYFRSKVRNHKFGLWWNGADPYTIAHEAGHIFSLDDHYKDVSVRESVPKPGWENDIMGAYDSPVSSPSLRELLKNVKCQCK